MLNIVTVQLVRLSTVRHFAHIHHVFTEAHFMVKFLTFPFSTAAPFQWAAIFHKEDINFTHGHHDLIWYDSQEKTTKHKLPCKVSCGYCHSPIMDEGRNMILLFPTLIHFKSKADRKKFDISCHMFYEKRVVDIPDGKPKWSGINGESDLIEDSPKNLIRKRKREMEDEDEQKETNEDSKK